MATGTTAQQTVDVVTPAAGESVTEGTILEWHVKVGDFIKADDTIVEISTDKVDLELPSPASGTVSEILIAEGETVTVGQVIARISVNGSPATEAEANGGAAPAQPAPPSPWTSRAPPSSTGPRRRLRRPRFRPANGTRWQSKVSPVAARAAAVEGVDLAERPRQRSGRAHHQVRRARALPRAPAARASADARHRRPRQRQRRDGDRPTRGADEGRRRGARSLHGAVAGDPHRHELPHAHRYGARRHAGAS